MRIIAKSKVTSKVPCRDIFIDIIFTRGRNFQKMYLNTVYKELEIEWALNSYKTNKQHDYYDYEHDYKSSLNLGITNLYQKKVMCMILHCTLMNIVVDSFPQVLFAMHLYSPL